MALANEFRRNSHTSLTERNNSCYTTSHRYQKVSQNVPCNTHHTLQTPGYLQNKCDYTYTQDRRYYNSKCANIIQRKCDLISMRDITKYNKKPKKLMIFIVT